MKSILSYIKTSNLLFYLFLLASTALVATLNLTPISTNDFWIQMKVGQIIQYTGSIPKTILFTFTDSKNYPFVAHEWLPSYLLSLIFPFAGYKGMIYLKSFLFVFLFLLGYLLSKRLSKNNIAAVFIALFSLIICNYRSFLRPEIFAYLFFLIQLNLFLSYQKHGKSIYLFGLFIANVLWANSHGSFLVSLGLPLVFTCQCLWEAKVFSVKSLTDSRIKSQLIGYGLLFLSNLVGCLINPIGHHLLEHVFNLSQNDYIRSIIFEWKPMFHNLVRGTRIFDLYLLFHVIAIPTLVLRFRKLDTASWILLGVFSILSFQAQRHLAFLSLAAIWPLSIAARNLTLPKFHFIQAATGILLATLLLFYIVQNGNAIKAKPGFYFSARMPMQSLKYLNDEKIEGNILNSYALGGQLIFHFYPKAKVSIDSRIDAYGEQYMQRYLALWRSGYSNLKNFLSMYDVKTIVVDQKMYKKIQKNQLLGHLLKDSWYLAHQNNRVSILRSNHSK